MRSQGRKCVGPPEDGRGQEPWELDTDELQSENSSFGCAGDQLQQNHTLGIPTQLPTLTVVSRGCTTIGANSGAKSVGLDQKGFYTPECTHPAAMAPPKRAPCQVCESVESKYTCSKCSVV